MSYAVAQGVLPECRCCECSKQNIGWFLNSMTCALRPIVLLHFFNNLKAVLKGHLKVNQEQADWLKNGSGIEYRSSALLESLFNEINDFLAVGGIPNFFGNI